MKKIITFLLFSVALTFLAGCYDSVDQEESSGSKTSSLESPAKPNLSTRSINWWMMKDKWDQTRDYLGNLNGVEGLDIYKQHSKKIILVILDLLMPEMNGKVCFEQLKQIDPGIKVIIASGMGEIEKKKELEKMGIVAYLEKPYRLEHMTEMIKTALNQNLS